MNNEMREKINRAIADILEININEIDSELNLFQMGLNSLGKIRLLVELEKIFDIEIDDDDDYKDDNFNSVDAICNLVLKYK